MNNSGSSSGRTRGRTRRASLKKAGKETTGIRIATQFAKKGAVGNKMINSITDETGARGPRTGVESRKEEIIISRGGRGSRKTVDRSGATIEIARRRFQNIRTTSIGSKPGEF
jgi:hypothetical protein